MQHACGPFRYTLNVLLVLLPALPGVFSYTIFSLHLSLFVPIVKLQSHVQG